MCILYLKFHCITGGLNMANAAHAKRVLCFHCNNSFSFHQIRVQTVITFTVKQRISVWTVD